MPRIRTIKPEYYDTPGIETLDFQWRILYPAMWNWADDSGRGKAEARELMGFAFPRDEDMTLGEFRRGLGEIRRVFGVKFYKVAGRSYYEIPSWDRHQKIDKRSASKYPAPSEGQPFDPVTNTMVETPETCGETAHSEYYAESSENPAETPPSPRRDAGAGTGEQGNRGTGEQGNRETLARDPHPIGDTWERFKNAYPKKASLRAAQTIFIKLADEGEDLEQIITGAERYRDDPNRLTQFTKTATNWLREGCWDDDPLPPRLATRQDNDAAFTAAINASFAPWPDDDPNILEEG